MVGEARLMGRIWWRLGRLMGWCLGCGLPYSRLNITVTGVNFCSGKCERAWHAGWQSGFRFAEDRTQYGKKPYRKARS